MSSSFEEAFKQGEEAKQRKELAVGESVGNELYDLLSDPALIKNATTKTSEAPSAEPPAPVSVTPIEAAQSPRPAPTTTESKTIPTELRNIYGDKVPARVLETFSKLKKPETIKNYLEQKKEEEETRKRKVVERKGRSGTRKPKRQDELQRAKTALQKEAAEEVRRMTVARASALKPSGADPDAPTIKIEVPDVVISPEAQKLEAEEQAEIDKRIAAERAAEAEEGARLIKGMFGAGKEEPFDPHSVPSVDDSKVRAPQYAPRDMQEGMDALNGEQKNGRIEPTLGPDGEPINDLSPTPDGTQDWRTGWTGKLREAVGKVVGGTKEKFEWWKSSEEGLVRRRDELDAQAEKISGTERWFRKWGERYNKMPFKYKVLLGASLGLGTIATAGTLAVAFPLAGIAGQRIVGLSSMYLKFEKNSHDEEWGRNKEWGKQKALLKAGAYTALLGLTMKEAIELASQTEIAHAAQAKVEGWLGSMLGHHAAVPEAAGLKVEPDSRTAQGIIKPPEVSSPVTGDTATPPAPQEAAPQAPTTPPQEAPPATPEASAPPAAEAPTPATETPVASAPAEAASAAPEPNAEIPNISVEATKGRGYEYMMKRLWEQLHDPEKHFSPPQNLDPNSDLARLLNVKPGDEAGINKLVHDLATDNEFYKENGTSVQINLGDTMTLDAKGNIWLGDDILAPAGAPVTPVYHPEAPATVPNASTIPDSLRGISPDDYAPAPESGAGIETPEHPAPVLGETMLAASDATASTEASVAAAATAAVAASHERKANSFGIVVPEAEPHLYSTPGDEHLLAYGGSPAERAKTIWEYLIRNPEKVVYAADDSGKHRVPWHLVEGKAVAGPPMRTSGFMSLFSPWMKPPSPNDFERIIK